jgi:hypothetical protein
MFGERPSLDYVAAACRQILLHVAHTVAPSGLPVSLDRLRAGYAGPIVDELRRFRFHCVRWNSEVCRKLSIIVINRKIRWNSCPARTLLTFFLFLNFFCESFFFSLTTYNTGRVRWIPVDVRWNSGGICGHALTPFPLPVPSTALVDCRSVHRLSGGNGPRRHRLFESRNRADNQFHRNSLAVHFCYHVCNRSFQAAMPIAVMYVAKIASACSRLA